MTTTRTQARIEADAVVAAAQSTAAAASKSTRIATLEPSDVLFVDGRSRHPPRRLPGGFPRLGVGQDGEPNRGKSRAPCFGAQGAPEEDPGPAHCTA